MPTPASINDSINTVRATLLKQPVVDIMDRLDLEAPALRYLAPLAIFTIMAEQLGRDPHDDIVRIRRILREAETEGYAEEIRAMRDLINGEMRPNLTR